MNSGQTGAQYNAYKARAEFFGVSEAEEKRITSLGCGAFYGFRSPDATGWMLEFEGRGAAAQRQTMIDLGPAD